jgi:LemA protein
MDESQLSLSSQRGVSKVGCLLGIVLAFGALVLVAVVSGVGSYNSLVASREKVKAAWQEIDNQYKRRYDLIPNLVETVKGAAEFERGTLEAVTEARAKVGQAQLPPDLPTDPAKLEAYIKAQQGLSGALGRLFVVAEAYPQLKANASFLSLQDQLEGTENRIATARRDYIEASREFNTLRNRFPTNLLANFFGFTEAVTLPVEEAAREAPKVNFGEPK